MRGTRLWVNALGAYFTTQALTQTLGVATGFVLVNLMPLREFAVYTLVMSFVSSLSVASDLGSTSSLAYFFRRDRGSTQEYYSTAILSFRRRTFVPAATALLLVFVAFGLLKGPGLFEVTGLLTIGAATAWWQLDTSLAVFRLRLLGRFEASYRLEVLGGAVRLGIVLLIAGVGRLTAPAALGAAALGAAVVAAKARRTSELELPPNTDIRRGRREVIRYVVPGLPAVVYSSVQGSLTVWLAAVCGVTQNVAEVGALGRIGVAFASLTGLVWAVFLPRLSATAAESTFFRKYVAFGAMLLAMSLGAVALSAAFPSYFLALLGPNYKGLQSELLLAMCGSAVGVLAAYVTTVNRSRSWTRMQGLATAVELTTQVTLLFVLPLDTTSGVLTLALLSALTALAVQLAVAVLAFFRPDITTWRV